MLPFAHVQLPAVLAAAIVGMIIGMIWYSPLIFGRIWMQLIHLTEEECKEGMGPRPLFISFASEIMSAYVIALLLAMIQPFSLPAAYVIVGLIVLSAPIPLAINGLLWERRPLRLVIINFGHTLVSTLGVVTVLHTWG